MGRLIERLQEWVQPSETGAVEVAEYVLSRREPDPMNRLRVYDEPVAPEEVADDADLPVGVYLLQEIKASGMAGDVVWEETLEGRDPEE